MLLQFKAIVKGNFLCWGGWDAPKKGGGYGGFFQRISFVKLKAFTSSARQAEFLLPSNPYFLEELPNVQPVQTLNREF